MAKVIQVTTVPVTVNAFNWVGTMTDAEDLKNFLGYVPTYVGSNEEGWIVELSGGNGAVTVKPGDYIVRDDSNKYTVVPSDAFYRDYELRVDQFEVQPAPVESIGRRD